MSRDFIVTNVIFTGDQELAILVAREMVLSFRQLVSD